MSSKRKEESDKVAASALLHTWVATNEPLLTPPRTVHDPETGQTLTFENVRIDFPLRPCKSFFCCSH